MVRTERGAWENIKVNIKTSVTESRSAQIK